MDYFKSVRSRGVSHRYPDIRLFEVEGEYRLLAGVRVGGSRLLSCASLEKPQVGKRIKMSKVYRAVVLSVLCWSLLAAVYLQLLEYRVWLIFILGIPVELIIWLSSKLNK